jgi:uncharacterized protein YaaQ
MKIYDPNQNGTSYYGSDYQYIYNLDKSGLKSPRYRDEQYISVSVSGYEGRKKCEHQELKEFARIYSEELKAAEFKEGFLNYKSGYVYSITCIEGFGPNPNSHYNSFFGLIQNSCSKDLVTAVLSEEAAKHLVFPEKEREFEHSSLALHGFIMEINSDFIIGWIVTDERINDLKDKMDSAEMRKREIWPVSEFNTFNFDLEHRSRYGFFPSDVKMYLENLYANNMYFTPSKEHLGNILQDVIPGELDWNKEGKVLGEEIKRWWDKNKDRTVWNSAKYRYKRRIE